MSSYEIRKTVGDSEWFIHDRFGMFIHFGLYALPARQEWIKSTIRIADEDYQKYFDHFNPDLFDAKAWAKSAKDAGMKYVVITAKHHEGFCLYDTKYTDYKITNTPYGKDLLKEAIDAFRAEGIRIGIYYSLIDWHHPEFTVDMLHPDRMREDKIAANANKDMRKYAQYMRDQVTELLTNYGDVDVLWLDYSYDFLKNEKPFEHLPELVGKSKDDWEAEELIKLARSIRPGLIINNRAGIEQDIFTPEQTQVNKWVTHPKTGEKVMWEACHTFSGAWGYSRDELSWKSPKLLLDLLIRSVACGGNLIMNVGPTGRGYFDYRAEAALKVYADWMKYNSRSIYGCTMAEPEFTAPEGTMLTQSQDGKRLYIHLFEYPFKNLPVENLAGRIEYIQFLHDASEIKYTEEKRNFLAQGGVSAREGKNEARIQVPDLVPNVLVPVIEIFLKDAE